MADKTPHLGLALLSAAQSQKHVTVNQTLTTLDDIVHLSVINRTRTSPPGSPTEGDHYIVAAGATDGWAGFDNHVAAYRDGAWYFHQPHEGWTSWVQAEGASIVFTNDAWQGGPTFFTMTWATPVVASGVLTVTSSAVAPDVETGSADTVTDIDGGQDGTYLVIAGTTGKALTFDQTGNMSLGATTRVLDHDTDSLVLIRRGSDWIELSYSDNG